MPKPTLAQLTEYLATSATFQGIDPESAANELYNQLYPDGDEIYILCGKNELGEVELITATYNATDADKLRSKLIGAAGRYVRVDNHLNELNLTPYYVELDPTGGAGFTLESRGYVEPVYTNEGGMYGTVFAADVNEAFDKARKLLAENYRDLSDIE